MAVYSISVAEFRNLFNQIAQTYIDLTPDDCPQAGGAIIIDVDQNQPPIGDETHTLRLGSGHNMVERIRHMLEANFTPIP